MNDKVYVVTDGKMFNSLFTLYEYLENHPTMIANEYEFNNLGNAVLTCITYHVIDGKIKRLYVEHVKE